MASWSQRRRFLYITIAVIVVIGAIGLPLFFYLYTPPSCFDGKQNGDEQGTDCGGSCQKLCPSAFLPVTVEWTRYEQIAPGLYNLAAYIINPNVDGGAKNVPYHMVVYDQSGVPIVDQTGMVTLPPHRNTLAFIPAVSAGKRTPKQVQFEFTAIPNWVKESDPLSALTIGDKNYTESASGSSLAVTIGNTDVQSITHVDVYAILYDKDQNTLGFSKTVLDQVPAQGSTIAPFTWPDTHNGHVISIEVLPVAE